MLVSLFYIFVYCPYEPPDLFFEVVYCEGDVRHFWGNIYDLVCLESCVNVLVCVSLFVFFFVNCSLYQYSIYRSRV